MDTLTRRFAAHWSLNSMARGLSEEQIARYGQGSLFPEMPDPRKIHSKKRKGRNWKHLQERVQEGFSNTRATDANQFDPVTGKRTVPGRFTNKPRVSPGQQSLGLDFQDEKIPQQENTGFRQQVRQTTPSGQGLMDFDGGEDLHHRSTKQLETMVQNNPQKSAEAQEIIQERREKDDEHNQLGLHFDDEKGLHMPKFDTKGNQIEALDPSAAPKPPMAQFEHEGLAFDPYDLEGFEQGYHWSQRSGQDLQITPRRLAAAKRRNKKEKDKLPMFADQVEKELEDPVERITNMDKGTQFRADEHSQHRQKTWESALDRLSTLTPEEQKQFRDHWNAWHGPKSSEYFADEVRAWVEQGKRPKALQHSRDWSHVTDPDARAEIQRKEKTLATLKDMVKKREHAQKTRKTEEQRKQEIRDQAKTESPLFANEIDQSDVKIRPPNPKVEEAIANAGDHLQNRIAETNKELDFLEKQYPRTQQEPEDDYGGTPDDFADWIENDPDQAKLNDSERRFKRWKDSGYADHEHPDKQDDTDRENEHLKEANLEEAREAGRQAFIDGRKAVPAHDPALNALLKGRKVGETPPGKASSIELMDAWMEGHREKPDAAAKEMLEKETKSKEPESVDQKTLDELNQVAIDAGLEPAPEQPGISETGRIQASLADLKGKPEEPKIKPGKPRAGASGMRPKQAEKDWEQLSAREKIAEYNRQWTQTGDMIDIGGNAPVRVKRVNKKTVTTDMGSKWPFESFNHTREDWKEHFKQFDKAGGDKSDLGTLADLSRQSRKIAAKQKDLDLSKMITSDGLDMVKNAKPNAIAAMTEQLAEKTGHNRTELRKAIEAYREKHGVSSEEEKTDGIKVHINSATPTTDEIKHALENIKKSQWGDWTLHDPETGERLGSSKSQNGAVNWFINKHRAKLTNSNEYRPEGAFTKVKGNFRSWLKSHGTTHKKLMGIDTKAEKAKLAEAIEKSPMSLDDYADFHRRLDNGDVTLDEYKEAYAKFEASREGIAAELNKMKKADIEAWHHDPELRRFSHRGGTKAAILKETMDDLHDTFDKNPDMFSYGMDGPEGPRKKRIAEMTQEHLDAHAERVKQRRAERAEKLADRKARFENPQTAEDWQSKRNVVGWHNLSPEDQAAHDEAYAGRRRENSQKAEEASWEIKGFTGAETTGDVQIVPGHHKKHDKPTFTVSWEHYVDNFSELKQAARKLGGRYVNARTAKNYGATMGFQFFDEEAAQKMHAMMGGEQIDIGDEARARLQAKKDRASENLSDYADRLRGRGDESLNRPRKDNTARRARMAASAEADARHKIAKADTIDKIVMAQAEGSLKHLNDVKFGTHVDLLNKLHRFAKYDNERATRDANPDMSWKEREALDNRDPDDTDIAHAIYPYPMLWRDQLMKHSAKLADVPGLKMFAKKLGKWAREKKSDAGRRDQITISSARELDQIKAAIPKLKRSRDPSIKAIGEHFHDRLSDMTTLRKMDIVNGPELRAALREYSKIQTRPEGADPVVEAIRELKRGKDKGFFPTPKTLISKMLDHAGIEDDHSVLEPSAGVGDIIDMIKERNPDQNIHAIEQNFSIGDVLRLKGHEYERGDFLEHKGQYDRIVMNPPFENRQDEKHVRHAYEQLKPGGRMVAITGSGAHHNQRSAKFQDWLSEVGAEVYDNPAGSFMTEETTKKTGVNTKMVIIDKPENEKYSAQDYALTQRFYWAFQAQRYGLLTHD